MFSLAYKNNYQLPRTVHQKRIKSLKIKYTQLWRLKLSEKQTKYYVLLCDLNRKYYIICVLAINEFSDFLLDQ